MTEKLPTSTKISRIALLVTLIGILSMGAVAGSAAASGLMPGNGTADDPYQISDVDDLQLMENDLDAHYAVVNDIDGSPSQSFDGELGFDPVGDSTNAFTGTFDGQGHSVDLLYIDRDDSYIGLFGRTKDATIRRVGLTNVEIITQGSEIGSIVGEAESSQISRVTINGSIDATSANRVGGVVGFSRATTIQRSAVDMSISSTGANAGGTVGKMRSESQIEIARTSGSISGQSVGGILGASADNDGPESLISDSYSTMSVSAENAGGNYGIGGILGQNYINGEFDVDSTNLKISRSFFGGEFTDTAGYSGSIYPTVAEGDDSDLEYSGVANEDQITNVYFNSDNVDVESPWTSVYPRTTSQMTGSSGLVDMGISRSGYNIWETTNGYPTHTWSPTVIHDGGDGSTDDGTTDDGTTDDGTTDDGTTDGGDSDSDSDADSDSDSDSNSTSDSDSSLNSSIDSDTNTTTDTDANSSSYVAPITVGDSTVSLKVVTGSDNSIVLVALVALAGILIMRGRQ